jgi:fused signal recognition particle receptor
MFDKLKKAFSNAISDIGKKEITKKDLENTLFDLEIALLESDVAQEVIADISNSLKEKLLGLTLEKGQTAEEIIELNLKRSIYDILSKSGNLDLVKIIKTKKERQEGPYIVVFLGINGTGKTTTVAKIANLLRKNDISVVLAASDTHRAGAIEQLHEHAKRLSLKMIHQRYGADPSAVARDAVEYGKKHRVDAILIDTAGRMQTAKNLMDEISKIVQVVKPDLKIFIGDSLAGNDAIFQATEFYSYTKFDGAILTKTDADSKGGSIISISYLTSKPIMYLGIGQNYDDIVPFDLDQFIESLFSSTLSAETKKTTINTNSSDHDIRKELSDQKPIKTLDKEIYSEEIFKNVTYSSNSKDDLSIDKSSYTSRSEGFVTEQQTHNHQIQNNEEITGKKTEQENNIYKISDSVKNESCDKKLGEISEKEFSKTINEYDKKTDQLEEKKNKKKSFLSIFGKRKSASSEIPKVQRNNETTEVKSILRKNDDFGKDDKDKKNDKKNENTENDVVYLTDDDLDEILKE